ncbi:hypothetical protein ACFWP0_21320 [Achromobacter sp. NPDC058515]
MPSTRRHEGPVFEHPVQLYASTGYGFDLDGNQRQAYYGNIGVRYKW